MIVWLEDSCKDSALSKDSLSFSGPFMSYSPNSKVIADAGDECSRIHQKAEAIQVKVGSPESAVYAKFGRPSSVSKSVGRWGVHKQLNYGPHRRIYIENGIVSSWQDN